MSVTIDNPSSKYSGKHQYDITVYSGGQKCLCEIKQATFTKTKGSVNNPFARYASVTGSLTTDYTFTKGQSIDVYFVIYNEDGSSPVEKKAGSFTVYSINQGESDLKTYTLTNDGKYLYFQNKLKKLTTEECFNIMNSKGLSNRTATVYDVSQGVINRFVAGFTDLVNILWVQRINQPSTPVYDIPFDPFYNKDYPIETLDPYYYPVDYFTNYSDVNWDQYSSPIFRI